MDDRPLPADDGFLRAILDRPASVSLRHAIGAYRAANSSAHPDDGLIWCCVTLGRVTPAVAADHRWDTPPDRWAD